LETEPTRMCALLATSPRPVPFHQHRKGGLITAIEECLVGIQRARGRQAAARHRRPGELYGRLGAGGAGSSRSSLSPRAARPPGSAGSRAALLARQPLGIAPRPAVGDVDGWLAATRVVGAGSVLTTDVQRWECATFERAISLGGGRSWCVLFAGYLPTTAAKGGPNAKGVCEAGACAAGY
jgi:hypothetical protein